MMFSVSDLDKVIAGHIFLFSSNNYRLSNQAWRMYEQDLLHGVATRAVDAGEHVPLVVAERAQVDGLQLHILAHGLADVTESFLVEILQARQADGA